MKRLACTLALLPVLLLGTGCRADTEPAVDQQVGDIEATLDAIESEMAGD
ncbi:hypothetical protein [Actinophytocola glycyrrhizae]|uniref:Uncharacterized protein n=1 Tax=Actinophytocola glycyrrhizae TaxID=2044873 RepID=A0ABV9S1Y4_9PSEU